MQYWNVSNCELVEELTMPLSGAFPNITLLLEIFVEDKFLKYEESSLAYKLFDIEIFQ